MAYPVSLDELTDGVPSDGTAAATSLGDATYQHDDHHRALAVAVEAVEAELGTAPSGASATVAARFGTLTNDVFTGAVSFGGGISLTGTSSVADRKITMQSVQTLYYPEQAAFSGCLFLGNGGASLAAGATLNTGVGLYSLYAVTTGAENTGCGQSSLATLTTGIHNTAVGAFAAYQGTTLSYTAAVGWAAGGALTTGSGNSLLGWGAGGDLTTSGSNVVMGYNTARGITTGGGNTVVGASITGLAAAAGSLTLVGYQAGLSAPSTATDLVALGTVTAGSMTTPGPGVVALGSSAGRGSTNLSYAALVGHQAGMNAVLTAAQSLVAIGYQAGNGSSSNNSTLVGFQAGQSGTGAFCTAVGFQAGLNNTYADVVLLGSGAVATAVNQFVVGSPSSQQTKWIPGHDTDTYLDIATANTWKVYAGGLKGIEVNATGGAPYLGFFGTAAVAKPTGVAVSAAGIHAALVTLGLIAA